MSGWLRQNVSHALVFVCLCRSGGQPFDGDGKGVARRASDTAVSESGPFGPAAMESFGWLLLNARLSAMLLVQHSCPRCTNAKPWLD